MNQKTKYKSKFWRILKVVVDEILWGKTTLVVTSLQVGDLSGMPRRGNGVEINDLKKIK